MGLVGAGAMGANHARVVSEASFANLAVVVDIDRDRADKLAGQHGAQFSDDLEAIAGCDAAIIATSTAAHTDSALTLLNAGIPLLIEKPLAGSIADAMRIVDTSRSTGMPVMCGFVERHNPALTTALDRLDAPVIQVNAIRHSPQNPNATASVVQDLLIHDIDLALHLADGDEEPDVHGGVWRPKPDAHSEIADCVLTFRNGMLANLSASRWGQRKVRDIRISTEQLLFEVDLLRVTVTVYRNIRQSTPEGDLRDLRSETIIDVPFVRHRGEPLALQLRSFYDLVAERDEGALELTRQRLIPPHRVADQLDVR